MVREKSGSWPSANVTQPGAPPPGRSYRQRYIFIS